ncbi:MAG: Gfo/Idh/MocA family oxidoreductase [Thermosynechococcaceae cyanobacterium]
MNKRLSPNALAAYATRGHLDPIRVGVIGVGNMGQHHVRVLSLLKDIELVGISDINLERGIETASQYRVRFFEDYRDLLPHVQAVCVAVPTRLHYEVGMACLTSGVHVLLEKPIAASIAEAESLVNFAAESQCFLQVGHIERFNPAYQSLSQVLKAERLLAIESHRMSPYSNRGNDVSVVLDLMIHDIDLLLELNDSPLVRLNACGTRSDHSTFLDYVTATLGFANGVVASLTASKISHQKRRQIVAHCQQALVEADFLNNDIQIHRSNVIRPGLGTHGLYRSDGMTEHVATQRIEPLHAELEHFVACVRGGQQPSVGGEQALKALKIASLIEQMTMDGQIWTASMSGSNDLEVSPLTVGQGIKDLN